MDELKQILEPISLFVRDLDLVDADTAEEALDRRFPPGSDAVTGIVAAAREALAAGTICNRGEGGLRFSRVVKPEADAGGCSIDAVLMEDATGPWHTHLKGEVCLCIPEDGSPTFEGRSATWMVLPEGSRHQPTVAGGRMLILYWWPEGAVQWG